MDILYLLIPLSVVLAFFIGAAFWFAVGRGQFDDLDGPAVAVVADDDRPGGAVPRSTRKNESRDRGGFAPPE